VENLIITSERDIPIHEPG